MGIKFSDVSPLGSLIGEGSVGGIIPYLLHKRQNKKQDGREKLAEDAKLAEEAKLKKAIDGASKAVMRSGGRTRSRPIDGKAIKGKTIGRFV